MIKFSYPLKAMLAAGSLAAVIAGYAVLWFCGRIVSTGGVDWAHSRLIWISCAVPAVLIGWMCVVFARQLLAAAKAERAASR